MGLDGLHAGWHRATAAIGPGRAGLRFGPSWAVAWWVAACGATATSEGVEGAPLDFNRRAELGWRAAKGRELWGTAGLRLLG
jgi:hypothetical protein